MDYNINTVYHLMPRIILNIKFIINCHTDTLRSPYMLHNLAVLLYLIHAQSNIYAFFCTLNISVICYWLHL